MAFHSLVNTRYFSEAATDWKKNGGKYTTAPKGSRDYFQYWEEQEKRCKFGYKVGDLWIPGRAYFYLNFQVISRVPDSVLLKNLEEKKDRKGLVSIATAEKILTFPAFWEIDYEWWNFKHIAWYGGNFMGVHSPGGKHMCCLKTRGAGFSYKEAADGVYNYNFIPGSKSYYFAGAEPYLIGDGILDKVQLGLDWINAHSSYWKQNRQKKFGLMHQKASFLDAQGVEKGTFSEIIGQIVDKPSKVRGKRGRKASFEEFGSFPNSEEALEVCLGSLRDGSVYVGQATVFGTGGEQGPGIQGLENIFNSPESWDMMKFPNVWEAGMEGTECGYFVPCYRANSWFMDGDGNVDVESALVADDLEREKKKKSGLPKDLDRRKAEYPRTPAEALQRLTGNGFNVAEIQAQIRRIQSSQAIQAMLRHGTLISGENGTPEFVLQSKDRARPIEDFPHKQTESLEGCVTIVQSPYTDVNGNVPKGMYKITFDMYAKEEADDLTSLASIKVWKQENIWDTSFIDLPVAWFTGRPKSLNALYATLFNLAKFYNCSMQGEVAGGGQGVITYAKTNNLLQFLDREPEMIHNKEIASKSAGNTFLMNMTAERKKLGILYLEDWHIEPRGVDDKGKVMLTLNFCYDIAFLRELEKFNPEKGNFDRVSDALIYMYMRKERIASVRREKRKTSSFFTSDRQLFGGSNQSTAGQSIGFYG